MIGYEQLYNSQNSGGIYHEMLYTCVEILNRALIQEKITSEEVKSISQKFRTEIKNAFAAMQERGKLMERFNYKLESESPFRFVDGPIGSFELPLTQNTVDELLRLLRQQNSSYRTLSAVDTIYITDPNGANILSFSKTTNEQGNYKLYTTLNPILFRKLIYSLSLELQTPFVDALSLPILSERDIATITEDRAQMAARVAIRDTIYSKNFPEHRYDILPEMARTIVQGEFGVADSTHDIQFLGTYGAGPCIILILWHPAEGDIPARGVVAHVDALTIKDSVLELLSLFVHYPSQNKPLVYLTGGNEDFSETAIELFNGFQRLGCAPECAINRNCSAATLDISTGKIAFCHRYGTGDDSRYEEQRVMITSLQQGLRPIRREVDARTYNPPNPSGYNPRHFSGAGSDSAAASTDLSQINKLKF